MEQPAPSSRVHLAASHTGRMPLTVLLLLVAINLLWAGSSLAAKIAVPSIHPMTLAFTRFAVAALLMYGFAVVRKVNLRVARRDWGLFWAMGILGLALTYLPTYQGLARTTASSLALLHATEPIFLSLLAFVFLREAMPKVKIVGLFLGLAGVYLIIANGWEVPAFSGLTEGNLLIVLALIFEASASIVGKGLLARYPIHSVVTYQMLTGAVALAPFSAYEMFRITSSGHAITLPPAAALWSLVYLILPCTVFGYLVWFTILGKREAGEMSVFLFIQPVAGAFLGAFFLRDKITPMTLVGAALVLLAVGLVNRRTVSPLALPVPPGP